MHKFFGPKGTVSRLTIDSQALNSNMLGDPTARAVDFYVPAGHDGRGLPLLVDLVGFSASGLSHTNWTGFQENMPERLDRLIGEERMPPVVVAFPDCFTRLGGNQYINSASTGAWEDYLLQEMLPAVEQRLGCGGTGRRGVFGKSSGGYGAITHALRHSDVWAAAACHSGDMGFEICYLPDMPSVLRALAGTGNSIERWWQQLETAQRSGPTGPVRWSMRWRWRRATIRIRRSFSASACRSRSTRARSSRNAGITGGGRTRCRHRTQADRSRPAEGALYRLRRVGSVQSALWRTHGWRAG